MLLQDLPEVEEVETHCGLVIVVVEVEDVEQIHRTPMCGIIRLFDSSLLSMLQYPIVR